MSFTSTENHPANGRSMPETQTATAPNEMEYRQDALHYVSAMLTELRQIAGKAGLEKLVGAIDAAYYEAYGTMGSLTKAAAAQAEAKDEDHENIAKGMEQTRG